MDWFLYDNGPRHERVIYIVFFPLTNKVVHDTDAYV